MPMLQWHGCTFLLFRSKLLLDLLCLHSSIMLEKLGTPALSSLAHLPTYNFHDHSVYFHINKAHPFKLGLNVIQRQVQQKHPHYLWKRKYCHCLHCLLIIFLIIYLFFLIFGFFYYIATKPDHVATVVNKSEKQPWLILYICNIRHRL